MSFPLGLLVFSIAMLLVGHAEAGCDKGWAEYNGHCWKIFTKEFSQSDTDKECQKDHARLASIHSDDEYKFVLSLMKSANPKGNFWIGLTITRHSPTDKIISCNWNDGSAMSYGNAKLLNAGQHPWATTSKGPEPNNFDGNETAVVFSSGGWFDMKATNNQPYICKK